MSLDQRAKLVQRETSAPPLALSRWPWRIHWLAIRSVDGFDLHARPLPFF